jgi:hypothetical protein
LERFWPKLEGYLRDGKIKGGNVKNFPNGLLGINEGLDYIKSGKVSGEKVVVRVKETPEQ